MAEVLDPAHCPLCGRPNTCERAAAAAAGREPGACWCAAERFPAELLARVPRAARRRACICADCLGRARSHDDG